MKCYSELIKIPTFEERIEYLKTRSTIGDYTFGSQRSLNQRFYRSREWKLARNHVIQRDNGHDLAHPDFYITDFVIIHHIVPITLEDIREGNPLIWDPENLVCCSDRTHRQIHYEHLPAEPRYIERRKGDTKLW